MKNKINFQNTSNKNIKIRKFLIFLFFLILAFSQVLLLNSLSTYGSNISKAENNITIIDQENEDLEQAIASASSVTALNVKARQIGLNTNIPILSLQGPIPVAFSNPATY